MKTFRQFLENMQFDLSLGHMAAVDDAIERGTIEQLLESIAERFRQFSVQAGKIPYFNRESGVEFQTRWMRYSFDDMAHTASFIKPQEDSSASVKRFAEMLNHVRRAAREFQITASVERVHANTSAKGALLYDIEKYMNEAMRAAEAILHHFEATTKK